MKVILALGPHPRQAGEMIDLLHVIERCLQQFRIKYRAPDILHCRGRTSWRTKIKNTHATIVREKGRHQMLPNKAAATCNEYLPHGSLPKSPESSPLAMMVDLGKPDLQALRANIWRPAPQARRSPKKLNGPGK
jgi:hypothetical protein